MTFQDSGRAGPHTGLPVPTGEAVEDGPAGDLGGEPYAAIL
ncbi:hypothetical protein ACFYYN_03250 [Streptomyces sp. NPDC001902]|nr:hypothetical protein [Streptomyces sp. PA03-1a]MDX2709442.1 hypothetical protein [Streptomyces sp. PA03-6a]MDX2818753.1 hypothetical protein [Streptomyces sp. PA03-5A]